MRTTGQKRKRPTSVIDGNSGEASATTTLTTSTTSKNNSTSSSSSRPGRQRLQRGAKDKVYAERLAAGNDNNFDDAINNFTFSSDLSKGGEGCNKANNNVRNNDTNRRKTRGEQEQSEETTSSRQSSNGSSSKQRSGRSSSKSSTRNKRSRSSGGRVQGDDGVERISAPTGWPFTSGVTNAKKKSSSRSSGGTTSNTTTGSDSTNMKKKNIGSNKLEKSTKSCSASNTNHQQMGEENVILKKNKKGKKSTVQNDQSATCLRTRHQKSQLGNTVNDSLTNDCGDLVEGPDASLKSSPIIDGSVCSSNHNTTDNKSNENECDISKGNKMAVSMKQTARKLQLSTQTENNSNGKAATKTDWSCKRCTLLNTNRRKKCQACGTPRYLTVGTDGIFTLDEGKSQMNGASSASAAGASYPSHGQDASSSLLDSNQPQQQQQQSQDGESGESQQSQLSAMIDAPVFTRSRRKVHLSQQIGMGDGNEDDGKDNDNNDQQSQQRDSSSNLSLQNHKPKDENEESGLRQWIQKRHATKREKRGRRKSVKNGSTSSALGDTKAVKVRVIVGEHVILHTEHCESNVNVTGGEGKDLDETQEFLEAIVPISVLSRIESQKYYPPSEEDNEKVEKQTHTNDCDERMERIQSPNESCGMSNDALNMQACDDGNLTNMQPVLAASEKCLSISSNVLPSNSNGEVHYIIYTIVFHRNIAYLILSHILSHRSQALGSCRLFSRWQ